METAIPPIMKARINRLNGALSNISFKPLIGDIVDFTRFVDSGTLVTVKNTQIGIRMTIEIPTILRTFPLPPNPKNNKAIDGYRFNNINHLGDFLTFNNYEPWVEILRDQTFMIKIDYWFEK